MIPEELVLNGIYSYRSVQKVDFKRLVSDRLFGIFGNVGSGKSTILEAITFCLYGETDRLTKADGRSYNLMNLSSDKLELEFTFRNGEDRYRFVTKGKRKKTDFKSITMDHNRYQWVDGNWEKTEKKTEEILGVSYENFKKTIIIPQGKFQEFLQLSATDRSKMLKSIFNLDRFDLFASTKRMANTTESELDTINGSLIELEDYSEEKLDSLKKEKESIAKELKKLAKELEVKTLSFNTLEVQKNNFQKLVRLEKEMEESTDLEPSYRERNSNLEKFNLCYSGFHQLLSDESRVLKDLKDLESKLNSGKESLQKQESDYLVIQQNYLKAKENLDTKSEKIKKNEEWNHFKNVLESKKNLSEFKLKLSRKTETGQKIEANFKNMDSEISRWKEELKERKKGRKDSGEIYQKKEQIQTILMKKETISKQVESISGIRKELQEKEVTLKSLIQDIFEEPVGFEEFSEKSNQLKQTLDSEIEALEILSPETIRKIKAGLKPGDLCPICSTEINDSNHFTEIKSSDEIEIGLKSLKSKRTLVIDTGNAFLKEFTKWEVLESRKLEIEKEISLNQQTLVGLPFTEMEIPELKKALGGILDELKIYEKDSTEIQNLETNLEKKESEFKKISMERESLQKETNLIEKDIAILEDKILREEKEISEEVSSKALKLSPEEIEKRIALQNDLIANIESEFEKESKTKDNCLSAIHNLKGSIEELERKKKSGLEEISILDKKLKSELKKAKFQDLEEVKKVLNQSFDPEKERKEIDAFFHNLETLKKSISELKKELEKNEFSEELYAKVSEELTRLNEWNAELNQKSGAIENDIKLATERIQRKIELLEIRKNLSDRLANLKTIRKLFEAQGFVNYVSQIFLKDLCESANERFFLFTGNKLRLELGADNSFSVRDYYNNGEMRSIKTLSGGQLFQASLAMAIALSDRISTSVSAKENFFFLDEGFGSLDQESLDIVFQTLKSLRNENRIVGLISHVEEMKSEIATYLKVTNTEEKGSRITQSWTSDS